MLSIYRQHEQQMTDVVTMTLIISPVVKPRDGCFHLSCKKTDVAMKDRTGCKKLIG